MSNLFQLFQDLVPQDPVQIGTVTVTSGGVHEVTLLGGGVIVAKGDAKVGDRVFLKGDTIQGLAPNLTEELIEI